MTYYLAKSPVGPHYAFTSRDDAERFKVSRLSNEHAEVVEVVSADEIDQLKQQLAQAQAACAELRSVMDHVLGDPHNWSDRPCRTCLEASKVVGHLVGCYEYQRKCGHASTWMTINGSVVEPNGWEGHPSIHKFVPLADLLRHMAQLAHAPLLDGEVMWLREDNDKLRADLHEAAELLRDKVVEITCDVEWERRRDSFLTKLNRT